jgi:hypothetical protein
MTCVELQASLAENESGSSPLQQAHLKVCPECSALVADLLLIACAAGELRAAHEPSPRVWNSIQMALRQEGLVRPQRAGRSLLPSLSSSWGWARWALPVAAAVLVTVGISVRRHTAGNSGYVPPTAANHQPTASSGGEIGVNDAGLNDDDLMQEVAQQAPALQAQYSDNLRRVNEYIQDAKSNVAADPNDEEARRSLMEAYQQKAMLFDLALDRSLQQ